MMGLGSAIGAGLFLGVGVGIQIAGTSILIAYLVAGVLVTLIMYMLGEMASARPSLGSFSTYAGQAFGNWARFTMGWLYWFMLIMVMGIVFEMPLVAWLLSCLGLINKAMLKKYRRHAVAILMVLAALCPVWASALSEVIVFAVTAVSLTVKDAAREAVAASEAKAADNTAAWKAIRVRANQVAAETGHPDIRKLAEDIRYADPTPTAMDGDIAQMLETLSSYADAANIAKAQAMMAQRKALAKAGK